MHRYAIPLLCALLSGCDLLEQARDTWGGLTNPLVAQGIVLGIEPPESDQIDLSGTDFEDGTGLTLFLADTRSVDDLENAPITGANVTLQGVSADETGGGGYLVVPDGSLSYAANATWTLRVGVGGDQASASLHLPPAAQVTVPQQHSANGAMTLALGGQDFHSALVAVLDGQTGDITYSNKPEDIKAVYEFTRGNGPVADVVIPGTAFPGDGVYAVGVAGVNHTLAEDLTDMNTALSSVLVGKMKFHPVFVGNIPGQ